MGRKKEKDERDGRRGVEKIVEELRRGMKREKEEGGEGKRTVSHLGSASRSAIVDNRCIACVYQLAKGCSRHAVAGVI